MRRCFMSNFQRVPLSCCPSGGLCTFPKLLPNKFPQMQWLKTGLVISQFDGLQALASVTGSCFTLHRAAVRVHRVGVSSWVFWGTKCL